MISKKEALAYHADGRPGKISVVPTKPTATQDDLALAYSPGVAEPCREIAERPEEAYRYTAKSNLVGVISNGTAVLGLGNIGALASKPVMEGKGVLFKCFADIDVFDIEIDSEDPEEIIRTVQLIAPTFGGINLEDIRAPECFEIERRLKESVDIPVFHDDQHGTAIICAAALLNALHLTGRNAEQARVVFSGAGAASLSCAKLFRDFGVRQENILMTDRRGVLHRGRLSELNEYKREFAIETDKRSLEEAMAGADVFVGLSKAGLVKREMVAAMAARPIIFAMANPDPEITPDEVAAVRADAIVATGRSDYPNQVNNVLGFPFIFRGALDVHASGINEPMKRAATEALAELARRDEEIPEVVRRAYPDQALRFGEDYIIPTPFDPRVLLVVAPAVAKAAMDSGVARRTLELSAYRRKLEQTVEALASR
ncbi:MAG: hypothetical protein HKP27_04190 [Myxococcales bacterium]|nr:hypothetical protein [Myxococcales bacterium]